MKSECSSSENSRCFWAFSVVFWPSVKRVFFVCNRNSHIVYMLEKHIFLFLFSNFLLNKICTNISLITRDKYYSCFSILFVAV